MILGDLETFTIAMVIGGSIFGFILVVDFFHRPDSLGRKARELLHRLTGLCIHHHEHTLLESGEELDIPFPLKIGYEHKVCGNCGDQFIVEKNEKYPFLSKTHHLDEGILLVLEKHFRAMEKREEELRQLKRSKYMRKLEEMGSNVRYLEFKK